MILTAYWLFYFIEKEMEGFVMGGCRGGQGFCSVECRSRQIYLDEMREIEASTKKMLDSLRNCHHRDGCESRELLEESGQRHTPLSSRNNWPIG